MRAVTGVIGDTVSEGVTSMVATIDIDSATHADLVGNVAVDCIDRAAARILKRKISLLLKLLEAEQREDG